MWALLLFTLAPKRLLLWTESGGFSMNRVVSFGLALSVLALPLAALQDPVKTDSGPVSGVAADNSSVRVYKGIPYAQPPVGDLRWKAPRPVTPWSGVREATEFSKECMQVPYPEN